MAATTTTVSSSCLEQEQPQQQGQEEQHGQPWQQRGQRRSRQMTAGRLVMVLAVAVVALLARGAGAFLVSAPGSSRIAAAAARGGSAPAPALVELQGIGTRLHSLLDLGSDVGGEIDENSDFYNPDGIQEGDTVEVVKDSVFYSIPKSPKEGVHVKGFQGKVASLKFTAKNGVVCSANRPVLVKFTEPYKFQGHFEFRELKKVV